MPIDQLANYAEVFGGIAVIISLIYLAFQVRANTKEQALRRIGERNALGVRSQAYLLENPDLRRVWVKGVDGLANLDAEERVAYGAYLSQWAASMMDIYEQHRAKQMPEEDWKQLPLNARPVTVRKGALEWWQRVRHTFRTDVRAFIDHLFEEGQKETLRDVD